MKHWKLAKKGDDHWVPLSRQAIEILKEQEKHSYQSKYVFPNAKSSVRPLSDNSIRSALRIMGYGNDEMTAHGFRAMARTLLDEQLNYPVDWIEHQLAHAVKDPNGRSYNRTKFMDQRREMMQGWADYLDQLRVQVQSGNVVQGDFMKEA